MEGTVFAVIRFPNPWPVEHPLELASMTVDNQVVTIVARDDGGLTVRFSPPNSGLSIDFQPIAISRSGAAILSLTWKDNTVELQLNGRRVSAQADVGKFELTTGGITNNGYQLSFIGAAASSGSTDAEILLVATLSDIESKLLAGDWYSILRASGLLRQLLLDGLVQAANQRHKLRIRFVTNDSRSTPPVEPNSHWVSLDPSSLQTANILDLDLDGFLSTYCLKHAGTSATVKDVIKASANAKGGIHFGSPRTPQEGAVIDLDKVVEILEEVPSQRALIGLCIITLTAMKPLAERIINEAR